MLTAVLSRADVARHCQALHLLREVREAYRLPALPAADVHSQAARLTQGVLASIPAYAVTVRTAGRSLLHLHDGPKGHLLAVMETTQLQSLCASMVAAVSVDVLAPASARTLAVLGSGQAASQVIKALRLVRSLDRVWTYEPDFAAGTELALRLQTSLSASVRSVDTAAEAVAQADIIVTLGDAPLPVEALRPGSHVTLLGAALPVPARLVELARCFHDAPAPQPGWARAFAGTLGDVLNDALPGRQGPTETTAFISTSPAYLELVAAWHVFTGAQRDETLTRIDFES